MSDQPTALRLADEFEKAWSDVEPCVQAAAELRRLHAENKELLEALKEMLDACHDLERDEQIITAVAHTRAAIAKAEGEKK